MPCKTDKKGEKEECDEEEPEHEADWDIWTDPLEELSEIEDAFEVDKRNKLHGKTILDVGTIVSSPFTLLSNSSQTKS